MRQWLHTLVLQTHGQQLYDISDKVSDLVRSAGVSAGLLTIFCRHTSASLLIQENADPAVRIDLCRFFDRLVRETDAY
jgi:secondary thiamine-phosphate synthase enzyme